MDTIITIQGDTWDTIARRAYGDEKAAQALMEARENILDDELYELDFRISSLDSSDPNQLFSEEIIAIVNHTLNELPEKTRRAFMMSRYENKSMKEIAESLNMTVKGVDYHIGKALQALRKNLKDYLYTLLFF